MGISQTKATSSMERSLLSCLVLMLSVHVVSGQEWQQVGPDSVLNGHLSSLYFTTPQTGFVIGCDPVQSSWSTNVLYRTDDSAKTWSYAGESELCMPVVCFPSGNVGYMVTNGSAIGASAIKKTTDGGNTWTTLSSGFSNYDRKGMFFVNESTGYYGGGDGSNIYRTRDGGATWTTHNTGSNSAIVDAIWFVSKDTGFIAGWSNPKIARTTDGGDTWADVSNGYAVYSIQFPSASVGYAVGSNASDVPVIIKTSDGGSNWSTVYVPGADDPRFFSTIHCPNAQTCYVVGDSGTILKTVDGGNAWFSQVSGTTHKLNSVFCVDNTCYTAGDSATLLRSSQEASVGVTPEPGRGDVLRIFPNPASSLVTLQVDVDLTGAAINMLNLVGETVLSPCVTVNKTLDVSVLEPGIYFLKVNAHGKTFTRMFIRR